MCVRVDVSRMASVSPPKPWERAGAGAGAAGKFNFFYLMHMKYDERKIWFLVYSMNHMLCLEAMRG